VAVAKGAEITQCTRERLRATSASLLQKNATQNLAGMCPAYKLQHKNSLLNGTNHTIA
jgi:hypothetical protein